MANDPKPGKLTLADFLPHGSAVNVASDSEMTVILPGFYTCGAGCPDPRACLANEHCGRGIVNAADLFAARTRSSRFGAFVQESLSAAGAADSLATAQGVLSEAASETAKTLEAEQYAKRDAEFAAWHDGLDLLQKESRTAALRIAFNAGWAARKKAEYEMVWGLDTAKKP